MKAEMSAKRRSALVIGEIILLVMGGFLFFIGWAACAFLEYWKTFAVFTVLLGGDLYCLYLMIKDHWIIPKNHVEPTQHESD